MLRTDDLLGTSTHVMSTEMPSEAIGGPHYWSGNLSIYISRVSGAAMRDLYPRAHAHINSFMQGVSGEGSTSASELWGVSNIWTQVMMSRVYTWIYVFFVAARVTTLTRGGTATAQLRRRNLIVRPQQQNTCVKKSYKRLPLNCAQFSRG